MPPKSVKLQHYSLFWQNSVKVCKDFTQIGFFYTNIVGNLVCFYISALTDPRPRSLGLDLDLTQNRAQPKLFSSFLNNTPLLNFFFTLKFSFIATLKKNTYIWKNNFNPPSIFLNCLKKIVTPKKYVYKYFGTPPNFLLKQKKKLPFFQRKIHIAYISAYHLHQL